MSDSCENHDDMLFHLLQECKSLPIFFDNIFGFLQRRTDFYVIANEPNANVGLPDGLAEKLVKHTFHKWKPQLSKPMDTKDESIIADNENIGDTLPLVKESSHCENKNLDHCTFGFTKAECYNGSVFETYCWSQTILDVDILVHLPENCDKKNLVVTIQPDYISVRLKDDTILLEGEMCQKCKAKEAIWSLDRQKLAIHLDKCRDMWWNCLVKTEEPLDISNIDCTRPYEDLPEEAQVKIQELQWNQERKKLGLPTSDEMLLQEKLKKGWNSKGSPFTGPFDPNAVSFS